MPDVHGNGFPRREAAGAGEPQNLSRQMHVMWRQGEDCGQGLKATLRVDLAAGVAFGFEFANHAIELPKLDVVTVDEVFGAAPGGLVILAEEVDTPSDPALRTYDVGAVVLHLRLAISGHETTALPGCL
ncbi:hypothetical protein [Bradyrhizobium sp. LTSPM299]|uniref:hypothetical protein n=1 Tax=Bradyrhizobium sp. LTSPM299 TaxID=1619233 RepID=UPI0012E22828|nr:hypothetical protein [Bradyrhizobium sp. LTSPM299]